MEPHQEPPPGGIDHRRGDRVRAAADGGRPAAARLVRPGGSGVLDRGDLELEGDPIADQDAAALERGVPVDAPVLAVDRDRALETGPQVTERVLGRTLEG